MSGELLQSISLILLGLVTIAQSFTIRALQRRVSRLGNRLLASEIDRIWPTANALELGVVDPWTAEERAEFIRQWQARQ